MVDVKLARLVLAACTMFIVSSQVRSQDVLTVVTVASDVVATVSGLADLLSGRSDTEVLSRLDDVLAGEAKIESQIQALGDALAAAEVAIISETDQKWQDWEFSLFHAPIKEFRIEEAAWKSTVDHAASHTPSKFAIDNHLVALRKIDSDLQDIIVRADDYGGVVYAPAIEAVFVKDLIASSLITSSKDQDEHNLQAGRRLGLLNSAHQYFASQLDKDSPGSIGAKFIKWEGQRLFDAQAFSNVDQNYIGNTNLPWYTDYNVQVQNCGTGWILGSQAYRANITRSADGQHYDVSPIASGPVVPRGFCPPPDGQQNPGHQAHHTPFTALTAVIHVKDLTAQQDQQSYPPEPVPVATSIQQPQFGQTVDWRSIVGGWNAEIDRLPLVTRNAQLLQKAVAALDIADSKVVSLINELESPPAVNRP
jgi:hypothetical protein